MEHARKMALVDPRLLDTLRSPPPPTDTVGKKVQALDDEMKTILDRKDLDDWTKVTLYNQVLQRYNVLVDKRVKEPVRVIAVGKEARTEPEEASSMEADVVNTVPKSLQAKARRLMENLKRNVAWNRRTRAVPSSLLDCCSVAAVAGAITCVLLYVSALLVVRQYSGVVNVTVNASDLLF